MFIIAVAEIRMPGPAGIGTLAATPQTGERHWGEYELLRLASILYFYCAHGHAS